MAAKIFKHNANGIEWYCEIRGSGPNITLIPSGEGDCGSFAALADSLADGFSVLTFDMPGFSRSSAPSDLNNVTERMLADQIAVLVTSLNFAPTMFYGCSSGGQAVLSLVADHPEIVRKGILHEAALTKDIAWPEMWNEQCKQLNKLDNPEIIQTCKDLFRNYMNNKPEAWDALGGDYHHRLEKNFVTWVRNYAKPGKFGRSYSSVELQKRPIVWSIGGFSEVWFMIGNIRVAQRANIDVEVLPCKHFPQVSIPKVLESYIRKNA